MEKTYLDEFKIAEEFLQVSKNSLDLSLRTSANRLYFAFEKAVISYLLFNQKKVPKNHQKIWELCAEVLGENYYNHLRNLYDLRMQADYGNVSLFVEFNKKIVEKNIFLSEKLIQEIKERLGNTKKVFIF